MPALIRSAYANLVVIRFYGCNNWSPLHTLLPADLPSSKIRKGRKILIPNCSVKLKNRCIYVDWTRDLLLIQNTIKFLLQQKVSKPPISGLQFFFNLFMNSHIFSICSFLWIIFIYIVCKKRPSCTNAITW